MDNPNFHIEDDTHWEVLQGCKLCQCEKVCSEFGRCVDLALDAKYQDETKSNPIKKKIRNLAKNGSTELAVMRINQEMGKYLKKNCIKENKPIINLTTFEKMCIESIGKRN